MAALIKARAMQLYYHYCHNLVQGTAFHADHSFFESTYKTLDSNYDQLVEYFIALFSNKKFKSAEISELVHEELEGLEVEKMTAEKMYESAIKMEIDFQKYLSAVNEKGSIGLQNTVQGIATQSDVRLYKIRQRING